MRLRSHSKNNPEVNVKGTLSSYSQPEPALGLKAEYQDEGFKY